VSNNKTNEKIILPKEVMIELEKPFSDERGEIQPLVDLTMKSCVLISSKKNTIRANHYHKTDWHFCYVLEGEIDYYHREVGDNEFPKREKIKKNELFFTPPMVEHAMVFHKDTVFLTLGGNSRIQSEYEADLVRVDLISPENVFK
jgi:dTDP-4-dehydrorhamnose 3,5-epimerase-like enzyme